jgi:hypothetical protein
MVSGTNDRYLQKGVAIPLIYEKMEPNLVWLGITRQIKELSNAFRRWSRIWFGWE